ncbi:MAG: HAMP domain-containing sensor histidine kinase [Pseudomonadota bacterium]
MAIRSRLRRIHRSVFTRLLLGFLAAGILVNVVVFVFFGHFRERHEFTYDRILGHYVDTLATAIGDPPDLSAARSISAITGLVIGYTGRNGSWTTNGAPVDLESRHRFRVHRVDHRTVIGLHHGRFFVKRTMDGGELIFTAVRSEAAERRLLALLLGVLTIVTGIVTLAYFFIRHIFKPLKGLREGVAAVHSGKLDHRVPAAGAQEFRDLAAAFNDMTARVRQTLQSREQLLLDVSHELRSPITRMKLSADMLPDGDLKTSISEDIHEMEAMVSAILDAARMQHMADALRKAPVDLGGLVAEVARPFISQPPGIEIQACPAVTLSVDADRMRTVIRNLLDNAVKYSRKDSPPVAVFWHTGDAGVTLIVQDRGIGISPDAIHRVFEPFFRADDSRSRSTGGFGLGLSLCKAIVTAHGGTIGIDSAVGTGTTVTICLPG